MSPDNPTLMERLIAYNAQQRGAPTETPPAPPSDGNLPIPPPTPPTTEQRLHDLEQRMTALEQLHESET